MNKNNKSKIVVLGQEIQTKIEEIDIFRLSYWGENPRVHAMIKQNYKDKTVSDEVIEKELWKKDSVKDLYKDIEKHGGLIDEILVKDNIVLEGNSRLCAYRRLYKKAEEKTDEDKMLQWSYIRARIIPDDTRNEVVFSILGIWHIKGKTKWDTYEKAAYLKRMNTDYGYSLKNIANSISTTEKFVKDHIEAHDLMVEHDVYTLEKFSYFYELVKNKRINELASEDPSIIPNTIQAIKEGQFKRGEEIRDLHKVLKDKKAKKEFFEEKVEFNRAFNTTKDRNPEYEDSFYNNIKKITKSLQSCPVKKIEEIKNDGKKVYMFKKLLKEVEKFYKKVETKN